MPECKTYTYGNYSHLYTIYIKILAYKSLYGWVDEWVDGLVHGWMDRWMTDGLTDGLVGGWVVDA